MLDRYVNAFFYRLGLPARTEREERTGGKGEERKGSTRSRSGRGEDECYCKAARGFNTRVPVCTLRWQVAIYPAVVNLSKHFLSCFLLLKLFSTGKMDTLT